jgi:hypothetical protein
LLGPIADRLSGSPATAGCLKIGAGFIRRVSSLNKPTAPAIDLHLAVNTTWPFNNERLLYD